MFGVSVKDRGAVPLAGRSGKAFWFSKSSGQLRNLQFLLRRLPGLGYQHGTTAGKLDAYANSNWTLLNAPESYLRITADNSAWETDFPGFGRTFPHSWG